MGGCSSVGRALEWHSRGQEFNSPQLHQKTKGCPEGQPFLFRAAVCTASCQSIFSLKCFAFQTIRPVVSRPPLFFRSLQAGRRCAAPPRVSPFSKLKRFKCRRNIRTPKRGRLPKGNAPVSLQAAPTQCRARAFQFETRCILNHTPVVSKKCSIWAANPAARQSCDRRAAACTHQ